MADDEAVAFAWAAAANEAVAAAEAAAAVTTSRLRIGDGEESLSDSLFDTSDSDVEPPKGKCKGPAKGCWNCGGIHYASQCAAGGLPRAAGCWVSGGPRAPSLRRSRGFQF